MNIEKLKKEIVHTIWMESYKLNSIQSEQVADAIFALPSLQTFIRALEQLADLWAFVDSVSTRPHTIQEDARQLKQKWRKA